MDGKEYQNNKDQIKENDRLIGGKSLVQKVFRYLWCFHNVETFQSSGILIPAVARANQYLKTKNKLLNKNTNSV
jgi:hypothetical protein